MKNWEKKDFSQKKNKVREITSEEIDKLIEKYGLATELCIKAGFEEVEIHASNYNFLQQFFSPFSNKRRMTGEVQMKKNEINSKNSWWSLQN